MPLSTSCLLRPTFPCDGVNPFTGKVEEREPKMRETALRFRVQGHHGPGQKSHLSRVYSGELEAEKEVFNATRGNKERVARLFLTHANKREKITSATPGLIVLASV